MDTVLKDLKYACRGLLKAKGLSFIAVVALALGIGLTTVMFSIVYGALHRGLPFEDGDRIIYVHRSNPSRGFTQMSVPIHDYVDWNSRQRSFEGLGAYYSGTVNVRSGEQPVRYSGGFLSTNSLDILAVQPMLGRGFTEADGRPGAPVTLVLGYRAWQDQFGGERDVLGRTVTVNGELGEIIGVMEEGFLFPEAQSVWVPLRMDPVAIPRGDGQGLSVFGRLRDGISVDQASADVAAIAASIAAENPETNDGVIADVRPFTDAFLDGEIRGTLYAMLATVVMVLFIACANVANLLLARAAVRSRDVAIRTALGASRTRVIVQMMAEAIALALAGAALGTGFAWIGIRLFDRAVAPTDPPFWFSFALDAPILAFVAGVTLLAALVSGAIPAWRASSTNVNAVLKDESRGSSSLHIGKLSRALVVAEVAMSVALLVASGLMIQSVVRLDQMELPFPAEDVFTARIAVFEERFPDVPARQRFWEDVEQRVASVAGVTSAGLTNELPGLGGGEATFAEDGTSYTSETDLPSSRMVLVSPGYFPTFDVTPIQGRLFTQLDGADATPVAIVNESFVRQRFADGQALGRRIRVGGLDSEEPWREIVGVVRDAGMEGPNDPDADAPDGFYVPLAQADANFISVAARTGGNPLAITELVRNEVATADADTPIYFVDTLRARIDEDLWFYSVFGTLFAVFGAAALFMASVGLYGVMSFTVSRRVQEMGIRMALGAEAAQVRGLVLRQGMVQIALGMVLGTGLAILVARGLQIFILGAKPWDPATYALVFAILTLTGLTASAVPARRATRVDPMVALRSS